MTLSKIVLTACLLCSLVARAQTPPQRVLIVELPADLDTSLSAEQFEGAIREAAEGRYDSLALEIGGRSARLDVIHRMTDALRRSPVPSVAWLSASHDDSVGPGQLILALFSSRGVVCAGNLVVRGALRDRTDALAPADAPLDVLALELVERIGEPLTKRGVTVDLARTLIQGGPLTLVVGRERTCLSFDDPPQAGSVILARRTDGRWDFEMRAEHLRTLNLVDETVRNRSMAWRSRLEAGPLRTTVRRVDAALADVRKRVESNLEAIDSLANDADKALDAVEAGGQRPGAARYREAAAEAGKHLVAARKHLVDVDSAIQSVPEVLRTPAPGQSAVERPSAYATRWRTLIRRRADAITSIEARAMEYAAR